MGQNLTKSRSNSTSVKSEAEIKYDSKAKNSISSPDGAWKFITSNGDECQEAELVVGNESELFEDSLGEKKPIPTSEHDVNLELKTEEHNESSMLHIDDSASSSENHYFPSVRPEDEMREAKQDFGSTSSFSTSSSETNLINDPIISTNLSVPFGLNLINSEDSLMQKKLIQNFVEAVPPCTPIKEDLDLSVTESLTSPTSQRVIEDVLLSQSCKVPLAQQEQSFSEANNVSIKLETLFDKLAISSEVKEECEDDFYKKEDLFDDSQNNDNVQQVQVLHTEANETEIGSQVAAEIILTEVIKYKTTPSVETETQQIPETSPIEEKIVCIETTAINEPVVEIREFVQSNVGIGENLTEKTTEESTQKIENVIVEKIVEIEKVAGGTENVTEIEHEKVEKPVNEVFAKLLTDLAHSSLIEHRFEFNNEINQFHETIHDIKVTGSFNSWCDQLPMHQLETNENIWIKDLYLMPGEYEYKFVINGHWICDKVMPFNGLNNVTTVKRV